MLLTPDSQRKKCIHICHKVLSNQTTEFFDKINSNNKYILSRKIMHIEMQKQTDDNDLFNKIYKVLAAHKYSNLIYKIGLLSSVTCNMYCICNR